MTLEKALKVLYFNTKTTNLLNKIVKEAPAIIFMLSKSLLYIKKGLKIELKVNTAGQVTHPVILETRGNLRDL